MVWTAPRTWVASEIPTSSNMNLHIRDNELFLKSGVALSTAGSASVGPTSGTTELVVCTAPAFTADGTTIVELSFSWYNITQTVATDLFFVRLYDGATAGAGTQLAQHFPPNALNSGGGYTRAVFTPTAGAHTYTARLVRSSGTGTASVIAAADRPMVILLRQVS